MGMLVYTFYNDAFYLLGAVFNSLCLAYAALLYTLSGFALVFGLVSLDKELLSTEGGQDHHLPADQWIHCIRGRCPGGRLRRPVASIPFDWAGARPDRRGRSGYESECGPRPVNGGFCFTT